MTSSSVGWSCATLNDGVTYMDLDLEEQRLQKELEETTTNFFGFNDWVIWLCLCVLFYTVMHQSMPHPFPAGACLGGFWYWRDSPKDPNTIRRGSGLNLSKKVLQYISLPKPQEVYMVFEFQFIGHMVLEFPRLRPNPMIPWHLQRQSLPRSQKVKFSILLYQGMSNTGPSANICSWYKNSPLVHFCSHLYQTRSIRHRSALRQLQRNFKVLAFQAAPMSSAESVLHFFQSLKGTWFPYSMILWSIGVLILFRSIDLEESNQQQGGMDPKTVGQSQSIPTPVRAHVKQTECKPVTQVASTMDALPAPAAKEETPLEPEASGVDGEKEEGEKPGVDVKQQLSRKAWQPLHIREKNFFKCCFTCACRTKRTCKCQKIMPHRISY